MNASHAAIIEKAYLAERAERLAQCESLSTHTRPTSKVFAQLHQEFDSLSGAARAANQDTDEHLFMTLARFVRYLRDVQRQHQRDEDHHLVSFGIDSANQYQRGELACADYDAIADIICRSIQARLP